MAGLNTDQIVALNGFVDAKPLDNFGTAGIIISGTWSGTITFQGSLDGVTFSPIFAQAINNTLLINSTTANGQFLINTGGLYAIRAIMTSYTSGTADVTIQSNAAPFIQRSISNIVGNNTGDMIDSETKSNGIKSLASTSEITGSDALAAYRKVNTKVRSDGLTALATDATVVVESTFGFDQNPDTFFRIIETGGAGTTWTVYIAGTNNDPTTPDRDAPPYTKIFTVQVSEVGDEIAFRDRIVQELNQDLTFKNTLEFKAQKATDRAIVHIISNQFSLSGEFWERPNAGDFQVTIGGTPGDGVVVVGFDNVISRSKPVSISRDFDSPHRLGLFGITGQVQVTAKDLDDLFIKNATLNGDGVTASMKVDGSIVEKDFFVNAEAETDVFVEELRFYGNGNGIKMRNFLSQNSPLTNGITVEIKSDNIITNLPVIKSTEDFKNKFSFGQGAQGFTLHVEAGGDGFLAVFSFNNPFLLRVQGTFTVDDYIEIKIRDNLTQNINSLEFIAKGFEKEP